MAMTVGDILMNADLFRAAYPNWPHTGPADAPLDALGEHLIETGAHWTTEGPHGEDWVLRWNKATGTVQARPFAFSSPGWFSGEAADLPAARRVALYIAELIADGKTEETKP